MEEEHKKYGRKNGRETERGRISLFVILIPALILLLAVLVGLSLSFRRGTGESARSGQNRETEETEEDGTNPQPGSAQWALLDYFALIGKADYEEMYDRLDESSRSQISGGDFVTRNREIYERIGASDLSLTFRSSVSATQEGPGEEEETETEVAYTVSMKTTAGPVTYDNVTALVPVGNDWKIVWDDTVIFPDLLPTDTVEIEVTPVERGSIYDRNGDLLAGTGTATSVGLVPGKMEEETVSRLAAVLDLSESSIENKLSASWVTDDSLVPILTVEKLTDQEKMSEESSESARRKQARNEALLDIPGVSLSDISVRTYPLGEAAAHLVGYVQTISEEELEADEEGAYTASSMIGKTGMESAYEKRLRGSPGRKIRIVSESGETKKVLAVSNKVEGENITVNIDSALQKLIYQEAQGDRSAVAAINPRTGEVLALVSTPSYEPNDFILGLSQEQWDAWNEDEARPLVSRFRSVWVPGSTFKPVTAAIGLTTGRLDAQRDYGNVGESWQKNSTWGAYYVTTIHDADPATLLNAIVVSDNVFFARAALTIGQDELVNAWDGLGFGETFPFDLPMTTSTYDNDGIIDSEIQIADSGYGQGEIQVNILHLASIYTAFLNQGDMLKIQLERTDEEEPAVWKSGVFSEESCDFVNEALMEVVTRGTGTNAQVEGLTLAGKTGTAEIKATQESEDGTELGWFIAYTPDLPEEDSLLIVSMVENVQDIGGSGYVAEKVGEIFASWCLEGNRSDEEEELEEWTDPEEWGDEDEENEEEWEDEDDELEWEDEDDEEE